MSTTPRTDAAVAAAVEGGNYVDAGVGNLCRELERALSEAVQKASDADFQKEEFRRRLEGACKRAEDWSRRALAAEPSVHYAEQCRKALDDINMMACYASEEDIDSREAMLLKIGETARAALSIPSANPNPAGRATAEASEAAHEPSVQAEASGPVGLGPDGDEPLFDRTLEQLADWLDKKHRRHNEWCDKLAADAIRAFRAAADAVFRTDDEPISFGIMHDAVSPYTRYRRATREETAAVQASVAGGVKATSLLGVVNDFGAHLERQLADAKEHKAATAPGLELALRLLRMHGSAVHSQGNAPSWRGNHDPHCASQVGIDNPCNCGNVEGSQVKES